MDILVFSSNGCIRCNIVKSYLNESNIPYSEFDITTEQGNKEFKSFYREHRKSIRRDNNGIFFPVVWDGKEIIQDAGSTLAHFVAGDALDSMVLSNNLGHGWTGGLCLTRQAEGPQTAFLEVVGRLKRGGLAVEITTDGDWPELLDALLQNGFVDRLCFEVFADAAQDPQHKARLGASLQYACRASTLPQLLLYTDIAAHACADGSLPLAEAIGQTARFLRETTGDGRLAYRLFNTQAASAPINLLPYRTMARRWLPLTELAADNAPLAGAAACCRPR